MLLALLATLIGFLAPCLVAEIVLRFLPVSTGLQARPVDQRDPILRYTADRAFIYSSGWDFENVTRGRVNNIGFVNNQDYDSTATSPLLAVIGDSYVEAQMVPYSETLQGRLAEVVGGEGRVYSFGESGAALSQYLALAEYVGAKFRPQGMVIVVVGNDFDESLMKYKAAPGFHAFVEGTDRKLTLAKVDYHPSWVRSALRRSALARYVMLNLQLLEGFAAARNFIAGRGRAPAQYVGNTSASADSGRVEDSRRAISEFLEELPRRSRLPSSRILFVVDGIRPNLYSEEGLRNASGSYLDLMRHQFVDLAGGLGFQVIDLQPCFIARYAREHLHFEFPNDAHWNGLGHEVAAEAVASSGVFHRVFQGRETALPACGDAH